MTYTPTTETVRGDYTAHSATYAGKPPSESGAEFDRWHADEIRKAKADAWEEGLLSAGLDPDYTMQIMSTNPYTEET